MLDGLEHMQQVRGVNDDDGEVNAIPDKEMKFVLNAKCNQV
jgi:hypothetical protein